MICLLFDFPFAFRLPLSAFILWFRLDFCLFDVDT